MILFPVSSKPPCVVVWLAFLAGIKGLDRYQICRELEEKLKELTITQKVCWRDLPAARIKPLEAVQDEVGDSAEEAAKAPPASQFSEVFACVPLSKPVEKVLIIFSELSSLRPKSKIQDQSSELV